MCKESGVRYRGHGEMQRIVTLLRGLTSSWYYLVSNDPLFQRGCELHRGRAVQPVHRDGGHHQVQQDRERRR